MRSNTLSVIMTNYNHAQYIGKAIEAILSQSHRPKEFIITDDASTDNSLEIIEQFIRKDSFVRLIKNEKNMGAVHNATKLLEHATGDYVYGAAADDWILPGFFEKAMNAALRYPQAGIIFGQMLIVDANERNIGIEGVPHLKETIYLSRSDFLREYIDVVMPNHSLCGATIYKTYPLKEAGYFREELSSWADTFAAWAIALKYGAVYIPEPFMCWRYLPNSVSGTTASNPKHYFNLVENAIQLMLSPEFRDRFPEDHMLNWAQRYRNFLRTLYPNTF
jgi:glycosyltransferase involved in cell wall biosynthesis